jgi:hypothetical protein
MTSKIYRTAQGKTVDLGTIMLQNEHVRAVGNMKVNARGDKIDSMNQVIETKTQQIQRQNDRTTTNVSSQTVHTSSAKARKASQVATPAPDSIASPVASNDFIPDAEPILSQPVAPESDPVVEQATNNTASPKGAGLAGAIARTRQIKQELDRTRRQQAQDSGVKKI